MAKDPYKSLKTVFEAAYNRAANGKGLRHVTKKNEPFEDQRICRSMRAVGLGSGLGQVIKKAEEVKSLALVAQMNELLDIIVYAAAAYIVVEESNVEHEAYLNRLIDEPMEPKG